MMRRILSIDGGGIKGTCPAAFLASLEAKLPMPIWQYFDLIAGTSTGGILAIGLAMGITAQELHELYIDRGHEIFGQTKSKSSVVSWLLNNAKTAKRFVASKHDETNLKKVLLEALGNKKIGNAKTRLLIPAWDADNRGCYIYKTAHHERLTTDYKSLAVDAAMATASAPTYFKRHRTENNIGLLDGGVWANNPIGSAAIEAITLLGWKADDLRILSLGCIDEIYMLDENPGLLQLGLKKAGFLNLFMDGQSSNSMGIAKLITGHPHNGNRLFRYSPSAPAGFFTLDDTAMVERLSGIGSSFARKAFPELENIFFQNAAEKFYPIHELEETS